MTWAIGPWGTSPWGGVIYPPPVFPIPLATVDAVGIIQATTTTIAEGDNAIGGFRMTRLTSLVSPGATTFPVESTLGWADSGKVGLGGVVYYYTNKTATTLTGITYLAGGSPVAGAAAIHTEDSAVTDLNQDYSALDLLRRAILVDYAEGEDLNVIGRNLGVPRLPIFGDDDQYREIIKKIAYSPKATILGLTLALDGILGVGNYSIYEDLINEPNIVYIEIPAASLVNTISAGKAFLTGPAWDKLGGTQDELDFGIEPITVQSVKLKSLGETFDFRNAIPSVVTYPYWEGQTPAVAFLYQGSVAEGTGVTQQAGSHTEFLSNVGSGTVYYQMRDVEGARIVPDSYAEFSTVFQIPTGSVLSAGKLLQAAISIHDGAFRVRAGIEDTLAFGLFATEGGGHLGSTVTLALDQWYEVTVRKFGTSYVELWVDGQFIDRQPYSAFTGSTTNHDFRFGIISSSTAGMEVWYKQASAQVRTEQDYWNAFESGTGTVATANPTRFVLAASGHTFLAGDVGKQLFIRGSGITNPQGGNNNGEFIIDSFVSGTTVELTGEQHVGTAKIVDLPFPSTNGLIEVEEEGAFLYPDDLGKEIVISGSAAGNNGTYVIGAILEPGSYADYSTFDTPKSERSNIIGIFSVSFTDEDEVDWKIKPVFVTETGLDWEQADAGSFSGTTLTLRQSLWTNNLVMEIGYSDVLTGQLLPGSEAQNEVIQTIPDVLYEYYPFYLGDFFGAVLAYIDTITASGVHPRVRIV